MLLLVLFGLSLSAAFAQPSRDWFLKFSDMIRDNKVDDAFFETEEAQQDPKYKDYLNTPGMGDGSFTSLQWAAKVREGCVGGSLFSTHTDNSQPADGVQVLDCRCFDRQWWGPDIGTRGHANNACNVRSEGGE